MFHEYALDPGVLSSWERTRFFLDAFGPWKGRFLAEFPRKWKAMVYQALACPDVERKRIEERLHCLDARVFSPRKNGLYDPAHSWLDNALIEHARLRFHAIIAEGVGRADVIDAGTVDDRSDLWRVESGCMVPREAAAYVKMLDLLLQASARIIYISPFFCADQPDKTAPLVALCNALIQSSNDAGVEVHFGDESKSYAYCMERATRYLPRLLPAGFKVTLRCWKVRTGGARLHNRYLLSEVGGVQFGDEIEAGEPGHEDRLSIVDEPSRVKLWDHYTGTPPAFDSVGEARQFEGASRGPDRR